MKSMSKTLTVYTRDYCHLCEEVAASLFSLQNKLSFNINFVDIDADPALLEKYNEDVPVVILDNTVVFRHFFDEDKLRQALLYG